MHHFQDILYGIQVIADTLVANGSAVLNVPPELEGEENEEDVFHDSDAV